ncbi:MAG: carboxypeptidase regulatory-like domain-containing protein [Deltaproteobacteria bacterium]|nr:carboxypeptidase regulatory-like domain-containing protein [Deltaproteobacteria bacterium]
MRPARSERIAAVLAALICLLFVTALRDVAPGTLPTTGPPAGATAAERDGSVRVAVLTEQGAAVAGAAVRAYTIVRDVAHAVADGRTDEAGTVELRRLPRGETWILARREGRARASTRLVVGERPRAVELRLGPARLFEVVAVDERQRPIEGVPALLLGADPLPYRTLTDARGLARLTGLGEPPYAVSIEAAGFDPRFLPELGSEDSPLFVKLERLGGLVVTVRLPDGRPAAGATVMTAGSSLWPARSATTDQAGRVRIAGLRRGYYDLRAQQDRLVSEAVAGVLLDRGESKEVSLVLTEGRYVAIQVTDGAQDSAPPVARADVALVEGGISSFPLYGRTDERGRVELGPCGPVAATVSAAADGFVARSGVRVEKDEARVAVALERGGTLAGEVVDERDFPVAGATLEVIGVGVDGMPIAESSAARGFREDHFAFALPGALPLVPAGELGVTPFVPPVPPPGAAVAVRPALGPAEPWASRSDGQFRIGPVPPGRVRLLVRHPSYAEATSEPVQLGSGGEARLRVVLREGGTLEGRVLEVGRSPVAGARVEVTAAQGSGERVLYAADDGSFAFAGLPPEVVLGVARPETPQDVVFRRVLPVPGGERTEIEVVLPERRDPVELRVVDDRGYGLGRVQIEAASLDPGVPVRQTLFTDDSGVATLHQARGLPLRLVLRRPGQAPAARQVDRAPERIELALERALGARGVVVTNAGRDPVPDAELVLYTPTGPRRARSDERGEFAFEDLAPSNRVRLLALRRGYAPAQVALDVRGDYRFAVDLGRIELSPGGGVEGAVVDAQGEPAPGALVAFGRVPTYLPLGPLPPGVASTDRHGRFSLRDLPAGEARFEAWLADFGRGLSDPVPVRAGETVSDVRIELPALAEPQTGPRAATGLAVTLAGRGRGGKTKVVFEHVPLGGEAERAGMEPGDELVAIDGVPVRSMPDARRRLSGSLAQDMVIELARAPDERWLVRVARERLRE